MLKWTIGGIALEFYQRLASVTAPGRRTESTRAAA